MRYVVTGAGGSIGSRLCEQLVLKQVERLMLVSLTESGLYKVQRKLKDLGGNTKIVGVLGSAGDRALMRDICEIADVVIHAAAHKHVPICEDNPIAAIENNVRCTITAAEVAEECGVRRFVFVSTDKAVRPKSIMGATKRVSESIILGKANTSRKTIFQVVRFGNVLDSDGSVLPLWKEQIENGGPVTITDTRCERYFMSVDDACELILSALKIPTSGMYILDMGTPKRILALATALIKDSGKDCQIKSIGLRPGEKLTEELYDGGDLSKTNNEKIFRVESGHETRKEFLFDLLSASRARHEKLAVYNLWSMVSWPKLFCLGIPKSGTCSIQQVMEDSGFRAVHTSGIYGNTGQVLSQDHKSGRDPAERLPYDAIVHPSNCDPGNGINYWPQMDLELLQSLRDRYPNLVFCLNTRPVDHLVNSIKSWKDQQSRYTQSDIPGLPKGRGNDQDLAQWIKWHYQTMRDFFEGDEKFIEMNIEKPSECKRKLSSALNIDIKEWPWLNRNTS